MSRPPDSRNPARRPPIRLLLPAVLALALLIAAAARFGPALLRRQSAAASPLFAGGASFAPYVDVTLPPTFAFDADDPALPRHVVLSFIVANPAAPCQPAWGGQYGLDAAAGGLDLDGRIDRLRDRGGDIAIAFGGAAGAELAAACADEDALTAAYQTVIDRYDLRILDFDVEGAALADRAANARRAAALARLQAGNDDLAIWLTVPVAPQGLTAEGLALLDDTLAAGVDLGGLNLMLMNYAGSRPAAMSMAQANEAALTAAETQLADALRRAGDNRDENALWPLLGATPMIGQNDVATDALTLADAAALVELAHERGLGRLSFWSLNRDRPCGPGVDVTRAQSTCSGVEQEPRAFSALFAAP
jgi:chitinase